MRFMIIRKADADTEAGVMPSEQQIADMTAYNEALAEAGALVDGQGLHPTSRAARITFRDGTPTVEEGPFEGGDHIAGFTIIDVPSRDAALEWVRRWPEANVELELRQLFTDEDFGDEFTPELRARESQLRDATGARL